MALFDMPIRQNSRANDMQIVKQSKIVNKATPSIKGGSSLLDRISLAQKTVEQKLGHLKDRYILIQDEDILKDYIDKCINNGIISIDTETTGLDPLLDEIAGICIYTPDMHGAYIPINHISYITNEKIANQLPQDFIVEQFNRFIDAHVGIPMFNADFDIRVLRNIGLHNIYCTWDCYLAQRLLNENEKENSLKKLHQKYVLNGKEDAFTFEDLFKGIPFTMVPLKTALLYAAHDPEITYELYEYQRKFLRADSDRADMRALYHVMTEIEMPCVPVVADMEDVGILFDFDYNAKLKEKYHKLLDEREAEFHKSYKKYEKQIEEYRNGTTVKTVPKYNMTGGPGYVGLDYWNPNKNAGEKIVTRNSDKLDNPINIKSTDQLAILLYDIIGLEPYYDKHKKKEVRTTREDYLVTLDNDVARAILKYREFSTIVDTFIDKLPNCVNPNDGRIHCKFNQYGAKTGRFSSKDPNMQNIPSHVTDIRRMFKATDDEIIVLENNNSFTVDMWTEVNTVDGWKSANKIIVGDKLIVDDEDTQCEISVNKIEILFDKNQIVYYY